MWWWDGMKWVPATQAPQQMEPMVPPSYYSMPPPAAFNWAPSPGLRTFLLVFLVLEAGLTGLISVVGIISEIQQPDWGIALALGFLVMFALAVAALVGVFLRAVWARWVALAAGIAISLTCVGSVIGIPIVVSAARLLIGGGAKAS